MLAIRMLALALGTFSISYLPQLPSGLWLLVLVGVLLACVFYRYWLLGCLLLGVLYGSVYGHYRLHHLLPQIADNHVIELIGTVVGLPEKTVANEHANGFFSPVRQRFRFRVTQVLANDVQTQTILGQTLLLNWYGIEKPLAPGQRWQLNAQLRRPRGLVNPVGFDYHAYLLRQQLVATGYVKSQLPFRLLERDCSLTRVDCFRYRLKQKLNTLIDGDTAAIIIALAMGDRSQLSTTQWDLLRNTGTIHLMAISGLHIGLAALLGFWCGGLLSRLWQCCFPLSNIACWSPACCSMVAACGYSLLAGMSLPTQRALIMVGLYHLLTLLGVSARPWWVFSAALLGVAIIDPLAMTGAGFWLSFVAVAVLLYGFVGVKKITRLHRIDNAFSATSSASLSMTLRRLFDRLPVIGWIKSQWLLTLGLLLPSVLWIEGMSLSGPLANLIAIPWVSFVTVPCLFIGLILLSVAPSLANICLQASAQSMAWLIEWLEIIEGHLPDFWQLSFGEKPFILWLCAGLGIVWLLAPKGIPYRYLGFLLVLPLLFGGAHKPPLRLTVLDVGQGTAIVVETPNHTLVYDTGPAYGERFNSGKNIIAPLLRYRGIEQIDQLLLSHSDTDHIGGARGLLASIPVVHITSGEAARAQQKIAAQGLHIDACQRGQKWQWDGVDFEVLWPDKALNKTTTQRLLINSNNHSCVLLIHYQNQRILLAGDIERRVEYQLLLHPLLQQPVDILLIPHHGSRSSSNPSWVDALKPRWAIASAAYHSRYGHPHPKIVKRYQQIGAEVLSTGISGALEFTLAKGNDWQVTAYRQYRRRYWYDR